MKPLSSAVENSDDLLLHHPFVRNFDPLHYAVLARCAHLFELNAGEYLWRQGDQVDAFFLLCRGTLNLEISVPHRGPLHIDTLPEGDAFGWSWLEPEFRWPFDARAVTPAVAFRLDGGRLREECSRDASLGYRLLRLFTPVLAHRLQNLRLRLLELHGLRK